MLPARALPYALDELRVRFPASLAEMYPGVFLLREHLLAANDTVLNLDTHDLHELRLLSEPQGFVARLTRRGAARRPLAVAKQASERAPISER